MDKENQDAHNDENKSEEVTEAPEGAEEAESDETQFDFAGELKRIEGTFEKKLSKINKAIAKDKFKERQVKKEEPKQEEVEEVSGDDFDARYERKREEERNSERMETADSAIGKLTKDPDEKALILRYVETMPPGGDLEEDIENAWLLANKGRIKAQGSVFLKKLQSMNLAGTGKHASQDKANEGGGGKLSQADEQRLINLGFKKMKSGRYESEHQIAIVNKDGTFTAKRKNS